MDLGFEWHEEKAEKNLKKHGVSFEEAKTVFNDPLSITIADSQNSDKEERHVDIGLSSQGELLVIVYAERQGNIRILSYSNQNRKENL